MADLSSADLLLGDLQKQELYFFVVVVKAKSPRFQLGLSHK